MEMKMSPMRGFCPQCQALEAKSEVSRYQQELGFDRAQVSVEMKRGRF